MAIVDFLSMNHNVNLLFFDHGTDTSREAKAFLEDYVVSKNRVLQDSPHATKMTIEFGHITEPKSKSESQEEYWRNQRYKFFHSFGEEPVVTCHHLDDCVETWVWSSMNGEGKIIPYSNQNVIRPFRLNRKSEFMNWCRRKNVPWVEDQSNADTKYMRTFIRHELMPKISVINPGIHKVIAKKVVSDETVRP